MKKALRFGLSAFLFTVPAFAFAQTINDVAGGVSDSVGSLFTLALGIINGYIVPIIFAIAFVYFIFKVYQLFIQKGEGEAKSGAGRTFVLTSLIGFFLMFSLWGIVNLLINTFGFEGASMPEIPSFNAIIGGTSGSNSLGGYNPVNTFGSGSGAALGSGSGASGYLPVGTTIPQSNGTCISGSTPVNGTTNCTVTSANAVAASSVPGAGTGAPGSACTSNTECGGSLACNASTGKCAADGPNTYSCEDDSTPTYAGLCADGEPPTNSNGDVQAGGVGGQCDNNSDCSGGLACNDGTGTCAVPSANNYNCADDTTPNSQGLCANGQPPENEDGQQAPDDGSVPQGGSCAGNEDACASGICDNDGVCSDPNENGATTNGWTQCNVGEVAEGLSCVECADGSNADSAADCPSDSGGGYTGSTNDNGDGENTDSGSDYNSNSGDYNYDQNNSQDQSAGDEDNEDDGSGGDDCGDGGC